LFFNKVKGKVGFDIMNINLSR